MPNDKYKDTYAFTVEPFSEDLTGCLSWGQLGNTLLRCAQLHAGRRGFGFGPMSRERLSWVFSRLIIDMERRPVRGEQFRVTTWASQIFRQFTTRLYEISDDAGNAYGHAYSVWALIDLDTRQPCDLTALPGGSFAEYLCPAPNFPIKGPGRIRVKVEKAETQRTVRYTDLDVNGHLNSIRSLEIVLDQFSKEHYENHPLRRIEMAYAKEAFFGERLGIFKEPKGNGLYDLELRKENGEAAVKAQACFQEECPAAQV